MLTPEIVFVVVLLLGRVRTAACRIPLLQGRHREDLRRPHYHWSAHAPLHILQLAANASARHYGWRTITASCPTLVGSDFHRVQPYAVWYYENISVAQVLYAKSRIIRHVWLLEPFSRDALLLACAGNEKSNAQ